MQFDKETQAHVLRVAGERIGGDDIAEVDRRIAEVMDMHPEFDAAWEMGDMAIYPQGNKRFDHQPLCSHGLARDGGQADSG